MSLQKSKSINREMERLDLTLLSLEKKKMKRELNKKPSLSSSKELRIQRQWGKVCQRQKPERPPRSAQQIADGTKPLQLKTLLTRHRLQLKKNLNSQNF